MEIRVAATTTAAARDAATWMAGQLRNAVRRRGVATLAVSGGTTPALMFAVLAELKVPWEKVTLWQVDERVVPDGHPARNAGMLDALGLPRSRVRLMPVTSRNLRSATHRDAAGLPERFDVVHLGMGDDGHTASWPPGDPVVDSSAGVALCGEFNGFVRMTLTPPVVNAARHRLVLSPGATKASAMRRWLLEDRSLPIQRVRRTNTVVVIDKDAAALLPIAAE